MTTATHTPAVQRALANIEDAKKNVDTGVAKCLDAIADLIVSTGDPDGVFNWVLSTFPERCKAKS